MRFTIRDVLWLTALVAMGLGWGVDHWRLGKSLQEAYRDRVKAQAFHSFSELTIEMLKSELERARTNPVPPSIP